MVLERGVLTKIHFADIFRSTRNRDFSRLISLVPRMIFEYMNQSLCKEVSAAEILAAINHLAPLKAPGKDGCPDFFFRKYWDIVGTHVCSVVKDFFTTGVLSPSLNITQVVLILKVPNLENLCQFRPISLYNFIYRIISKILANRLKPIMKILISPQQSAFIYTWQTNLG